MFRIFIAAAALAALAGGAQAQGSRDFDPGQVTVYGQPRDGYAIRIDTQGKDRLTVQREISSAAHVACRRAPVTGRRLTLQASQFVGCVSEARWDAGRQLDRVIAQRNRASPIALSANTYSGY